MRSHAHNPPCAQRALTNAPRVPPCRPRRNRDQGERAWLEGARPSDLAFPRACQRDPTPMLESDSSARPGSTRHGSRDALNSRLLAAQTQAPYSTSFSWPGPLRAGNDLTRKIPGRHSLPHVRPSVSTDHRGPFQIRDLARSARTSSRRRCQACLLRIEPLQERAAPEQSPMRAASNELGCRPQVDYCAEVRRAELGGRTWLRDRAAAQGDHSHHPARSDSGLSLRRSIPTSQSVTSPRGPRRSARYGRPSAASISCVPKSAIGTRSLQIRLKRRTGPTCRRWPSAKASTSSHDQPDHSRRAPNVALAFTRAKLYKRRRTTPGRGDRSLPARWAH